MVVKRLVGLSGLQEGLVRPAADEMQVDLQGQVLHSTMQHDIMVQVGLQKFHQLMRVRTMNHDARHESAKAAARELKGHHLKPPPEYPTVILKVMTKYQLRLETDSRVEGKRMEEGRLRIAKKRCFTCSALGHFGDTLVPGLLVGVKLNLNPLLLNQTTHMVEARARSPEAFTSSLDLAGPYAICEKAAVALRYRRSGIEMIEGDSPESIVSSQELDTPPWWAALLKQHTRHLQFDDSAALPISLLGQGYGRNTPQLILTSHLVRNSEIQATRWLLPVDRDAVNPPSNLPKEQKKEQKKLLLNWYMAAVAEKLGLLPYRQVFASSTHYGAKQIKVDGAGVLQR
ncbi:hypothetical protein AK812_SmicGene18812 [Symbiodinium microadriaticum]|uniref:Uncharacterized protein n=1 Tax=Symbiodinium microadriaticum TaxID=2951 RepID=A0A1Q9DU70_SYMMI|nr:hypothetical protein AK812_SmicGene18812 [Symbiodinium microadriaticum]